MKISKKEREASKQTGDELMRVVRVEVNSCLLLHDVGRLSRLVSAIANHMDAELVRTIRDKGHQKELDQLCDKIGREEA